MKKYSNEVIIQGILDHNREVLQHIYLENYRKIKQLVTTNNGSADEADDIFQESIMVIYNKVQKHELKLSASFGTYFYAVANILWRNELKRKKTHTNDEREVISLLDESDIVGEYEKNERHKLVWHYFEKLTDDCKKVITLFIDGHSITEVTEMMGYSSEQHTKNRRLRCKNTLIEHIMSNPKYKELITEPKVQDEQANRW